MRVSFAESVSSPTEILVSHVGDESVILNLNSECYFGLDAVGTRMWTVLTTSESIQAAYETLLREYEVDAESLRRDLDDLIEKSVEHGILEISSD